MKVQQKLQKKLLIKNFYGLATECYTNDCNYFDMKCELKNERKFEEIRYEWRKKRWQTLRVFCIHTYNMYNPLFSCQMYFN